MRSFHSVGVLLWGAVILAATVCGQCPSSARCPYDPDDGLYVGEHDSQGIHYCDYEHKYLNPEGKPATHRFSNACR